MITDIVTNYGRMCKSKYIIPPVLIKLHKEKDILADVLLFLN